MKILTQDQQLEKSYDYIVRILTKQQKVLPFELIYGDGSIHGQLTRDSVRLLYETMTKDLTTYYDTKEDREKHNLSKHIK